MIKKIIIFSFFCLISISLFAVFFGLNCNKAMALTTEKIDYISSGNSYPVLKINKSNDRYSMISTASKLNYGYEDVNGQFYNQIINPNANYNVYFASLDLDNNGYAHISYGDDTYGYLRYSYQDASGWHSEIVDDINMPINYTSIAIDSNGYPHISYANYNYVSYRCNVMYAYKDVAGWHYETILTNLYSNTRYLSFALDSFNYPHVSYYDYLGGRNLIYAFKDISGWHQETIDSVDDVGKYNSIAVDSLNQPHISYYDDTNDDLKYAFKASGGAWAVETVDSSSVTIGTYTSIVTDSTNRPHISYIDVTNVDLKYTYKDSGAWNSAIASSDVSASYTSIDLTSTGLPQIGYTYSTVKRAYYNGAWNIDDFFTYYYLGNVAKIAVDNNDQIHMSAPNGSRMNFAFKDDYGWNKALVDSSTNISNYIQYSSIALDQNNYSHISYYDGINYDLKYAYQDASGWHTETAVSANNVGTHNSIAIDQNGYPHISYYDASTGYIAHAYKDGTGWHTENIGSTSYTVWTSDYKFTTSIAINSANYPCVSYYENANTDLIYAYKDISGWHRETADLSSGAVGYNSSLDLDSSNYPHIAYYDDTNYKIKYAYKDISGWHSENVDTDISYGYFVTLKLNSQNKPLISYYDQNNKRLTFAYKDSSWIVRNVSEISAFGLYPNMIVESDDTVHIVGLYSNYLYDIYGSAPTSTSISINSGASYTTSTAVTLDLSASSDAYQMMVSEDPAFTGASWETYATSKNFTLSSGDGTKTIYVKYRDMFLSESTAISSSIILDQIAPTISSISYTPDPAKDGVVTATIVFSEIMSEAIPPVVEITGLRDENYIFTQTSYTDNTWTGSLTLDNLYTNTSGYISVRNAKDLAGSVMISQPEAAIFTAINPSAIDFDKTIDLESAILLRNYQDQIQDLKVYFYEKPSNSTGLYLTLIRKNKKYSSKHFIKSKLYPSYLNLKSNIKNIRKTTFKITFHYKTKKLKKNKLKEKNLRLFIKDRDNKWRGPFTVYQNKEKNILKFKIRNYYLKPGLAFVAKNTKSNRNYAPFFKFSNISKIKFVIADKDAFQL